MITKEETNKINEIIKEFGKNPILFMKTLKQFIKDSDSYKKGVFKAKMVLVTGAAMLTIGGGAKVATDYVEDVKQTNIILENDSAERIVDLVDTNTKMFDSGKTDTTTYPIAAEIVEDQENFDLDVFVAFKKLNSYDYNEATRVSVMNGIFSNMSSIDENVPSSFRDYVANKGYTKTDSEGNVVADYSKYSKEALNTLSSVQEFGMGIDQANINQR